MRDYLTEGKRKGMLEPYEVPEDDAYIVNEVHDGIFLNNKKIRRAVFINVSLKEADISDCDVSYSIFINCYFRGAKFRGVNFTGSKFYECNFRSASLVDCKLLYTKWKETYIRKDTVLGNLPSYPNVAQELLINLRMNAATIGEYEDGKSYLYQSEALSRTHLLNIFRRYSDYYRKYSAWERIKAFFSLCRSYTERFFWGYGEKPGALFFSAAAIVSSFAAIYLIKAPRLFGLGGQNLNVIRAFFDAEKFSVLAFTGNTPHEMLGPQYQSINTMVTVESLFGLIFIGFLAASLHRKISTRRD